MHSGAKKRKRPKSIDTEPSSVVTRKKPKVHHKAKHSRRVYSMLPSPLKQATVSSVPSSPTSPTTQPQTEPERTISLKYADPSMRYRGKVWRFESIAHKAMVLERILLREEKEVESYPIMAFSKGAQKAPPGPDDDDDGIGIGSNEDVVKNYFRFYTHFMNERFPGNERLLLENGVKPSA
jgi:hypothetical protein